MIIAIVFLLVHTYVLIFTRELLKQAEGKTNRFDREVESGIEQLGQPNNPFEVSSRPKPDLWILLGVVAIALCLRLQKQKAT